MRQWSFAKATVNSKQCATAPAESEQAPDGAPESEQDMSGGPHVRSSNGRTLMVG
jgi:hypothetical protein